MIFNKKKKCVNFYSEKFNHNCFLNLKNVHIDHPEIKKKKKQHFLYCRFYKQLLIVPFQFKIKSLTPKFSFCKFYGFVDFNSMSTHLGYSMFEG